MAKTESKTRNPRRVGCVVTAEPRRRGLLRFKERYLARAIRAMRKAGIEPGIIEVTQNGALIHAALATPHKISVDDVCHV